ncbi:MAG: DUF2312 domain-containing protein [Methylocystis sp.]|nr:DUF2312 domain-containing protein [Methylocystis sp.]
MTEPTHNSVDDAALRAIFDRIVAVEEEKRECAADLAELYKEAKSQGFDLPALRETVKAHFLLQDEDRRRKAREKEEIADLYKRALQLPLF